MTAGPCIVVLIPHYNNLPGLERSLASISDREPVDILIVDDGSRERPDPDALQGRHPQVRGISCIALEQNQGIEHALNRGLAQILAEGRYRYIARLDCGDRCHPDRFAVQRRFLEAHPDIALVGSWVSYVDMEGREVFIFRFPERHDEIRRRMYLNNMFAHPAVMFRADAARQVGLYDIAFRCAEDYAYFFRFVRRFRTANIPSTLITYELDPAGISRKNRRTQILSRLRIILANWTWRPYALWGLMRNVILLALPARLVSGMKRIVYR